MSNARSIVETWTPSLYSLNSSVGLDGAPPVNVMTFPNPVAFYVDRVTVNVTWHPGQSGAASIALYGRRADRQEQRIFVYLHQLTEVPDWLESLVLRAFPVGVEVSWR